MSSNDELPLFTSNISQEVKIRMGEAGQASLPPKTVMHSFDSVCSRFGELPALHQKIPLANVSYIVLVKPNVSDPFSHFLFLAGNGTCGYALDLLDLE